MALCPVWPFPAAILTAGAATDLNLTFQAGQEPVTPALRYPNWRNNAQEPQTMPTAWNQMSPDEKLDEVHDSIQRLIDIANASDHRLALIEQLLADLQTAATMVLDRTAEGWSERP